MKKLYFADCLDVLKELHKEHPKGFIDLIYIDPPFNSKRDYNILFETVDLKDTKAQKEAFADTWSNVSYLDTLEEIKELDLDLYKLLHTLDEINISQAAVSYLTTMSIRIYFMHKVLKDSGSFYLHCDPTMSHYLKMVCDQVFGEKNFRNEIIWQKIRVEKAQSNNFAKLHDVIFFYSKSDGYFFNQLRESASQEYIDKYYNQIEPDTQRRYQLISFLQAGQGQPRKFGDRIIAPPKGRHWIWSQERIDEAIEKGLLVFTSPDKPRLKRYLDDYSGKNIGSIWTDIAPINSQAKERLGYPTQKPESLLERIIVASSKNNDLIADFFCGCGTTISVAEKLDRQWLGTDISHLAIKLIVDRITKSYSKPRATILKNELEIKGFPRDLASAQELAKNTKDGRFGFQDWIIEVMLGGVLNPKRTADGGWDGHITFERPDIKEKGVILIEVKSGNVNVKNIREFIQVIEKQKADIGVFVCFNAQITQPMLKEAKQRGYFDETHYKNRIDRIQIISVEELLEGKGINLPTLLYEKTTFKSAKKTLKEGISDQHEIF